MPKVAFGKGLTADEKKIKEAQDQLTHTVAKGEEAPETAEALEDMQLAFKLLGKYKKDRTFIQKDV